MIDRRILTFSHAIRGSVSDVAGNAMLEFALIAPIFVFLLLNMVDYSRLVWARMQTNSAAQIGVQAAFKACGGGNMPASKNCSNLNSVVTSAVQQTTLGTSVSLANNYPAETYYCVSGTTLIAVGSYPQAKPSDCSSAGSPTTTPGDYIEVAVTYSYNPIFGGLSLASTQTLTGNALERLQ